MVGSSPHLLPSKVTEGAWKDMYTVFVPPLPAIAEVSLTQAVAEAAFGVHDGVHDSSQALYVVAQALSEQKRTLPRSVAAYAGCKCAGEVGWCGTVGDVAEDWVSVRVSVGEECGLWLTQPSPKTSVFPDATFEV